MCKNIKTYTITGENMFTYNGKIGFDNKKYVKLQSDAIIERATHFHKLYLEFGGKLLYDYHAARVLPGYELNAKMQVIKKLAGVGKRKVEFLFCISAKDLQHGKQMGALGINYRNFSLKMIDTIEEQGFTVPNIVINLFSGESKAKEFGRYLRKEGYNVYYRNMIKNYPNNIKHITSSKGFGKKPFIRTKSSIVIVTGAGPGSGKLATCLTMVYQDHLRKKDSGYAKFETFPVWNLPLNSSINVAYEAATADLGDYNMIDPYHFKAYKIKAVNYNRDVESFKLIQQMIKKIISKNNYMRSYKSPTDMGINMVQKGITDILLCEHAARQEIIRRYFDYKVGVERGNNKDDAVVRVAKLMKKQKITFDERPVIKYAREAAKRGKGHRKLYIGSAIMVNDKIITGVNSSLMHAESAVIINTLKQLAGIRRHQRILSSPAIKQVKKLRKMLNEKSENLNISEALLVLSISAKDNKYAHNAFSQIKKLDSCEMHTTHMLSKEDESILRKLKINYTSDGNMAIGRLYSG